MGRKVGYSGSGDWNIMVRLPEELATKVAKALKERGSTCSDLVRTAVFNYICKI